MKVIPEKDIAYEMYREVLHYKHMKYKAAGGTSYSVYEGETLNYSGEPMPHVEEEK
jgi:hypothetical protein